MRFPALKSSLVLATGILAGTLALAGAPAEKTEKAAPAPAQAQAKPATPAKSPWPQVLAKVGDQTITRDDALDYIIDEVARGQQQQPYDFLGQVLDQMIASRLMDAEAAKSGKQTNEWLEEQIAKRAAEPGDSEIEATYNRFKARLGDQTLEQAKPNIVRYLKNQQGQAIAQKIVDDLRSKANVKILVEPQRVNVAENGRPSRGAKNAPVTIIEFSDYQCPFCSRAEGTIWQVRQVYGDKVRIVFRDYPLSFHANAQKSAEATGCAEEQGKFWEMHDHLFENQGALTVPDLKKYAGELGLDQKKFDECLDSGKRADAVKKDFADGSTAGVSGTPGFFVNGRFVNGAQPFEKFATVIDDELTRANLPVPAKPDPLPTPPAPKPKPAPAPTATTPAPGTAAPAAAPKPAAPKADAKPAPKK